MKNKIKVIKVVKMISYSDAKKFDDDTIGGLGGFFQNGMRWKDYIDTIPGNRRKYAEAFRSYILRNNIKGDGDWHQNSDEGVPLFSDGKVATFSYRAWGDIMAAVWSEKENHDYDYMDFYMQMMIPWIPHTRNDLGINMRDTPICRQNTHMEAKETE